MKKIIHSLLALTLIFSVSCSDEVEFSSNTEALGEFQIISPKNSVSYSLNSGTPENTIVFNWTEAQPGVSKEATYRVDFFKVDEETAFISFSSDSEGKLNALTVTFTDLDTALESTGFAAGENATVQWQVIATNGDVEVKSGKTNITITRFAEDGLAAFNLLSPSNNNVVTADIYVTPTEEIEFTWEPATTTSGSGSIKYEVLFDTLNGDFSSPLNSFEITSGESFTITHQEIGVNFGDNPNVKWTVKATIDGTEISLNAEPRFVNWDVFVINEFYLVGDHNSWDNATATPFVNKGNGAFELQIDLPANAGFKFLPQLGSWDGDWGEDPAIPGKIIQDGEQNISIVNAGRYIIKVDFPTLSFTVTEFIAPDNLFLTGSPVGWDATNGVAFHNHGDGIFSLTYNFEATAEFKFLPTNIDFSDDWGEDPANIGTIIQDGEQNIKITEGAGTYVVIVDYNTLTYKLAKIDTLFMVGDHNGWNNADASQEFNTSGNGVFTRIQTFDAGQSFKLLPISGSWDSDWGEDPVNAGRIVQEGEDNIQVVNAGAYIITIDFNTLSYTLLEVPENLFLVGSPNGWDNTTAPEFTKLSEGVFELSLTLSSTDEFKFLPVQGSWDNDWAESPDYPGMIVSDNEQNAKSPGDGTYTITVDFNKGTFTVE
ncbi:uncharacterized protein DUF5019 [Tenacibaculum adriaticum]|uniref:Uncharacterized protein DUF5019 n=1 Tax=Tenacibaculum adriaticum TaxID=413713 RepID=A0A5S5DTE9_9FLAO|nr:SusF/SusE family outer membrane protein [Tenacibaculum adriaticum]TYP99045.1 uncharacterized protein DUF5019 [Tenacibaculum adriaticum]